MTSFARRQLLNSFAVSALSFLVFFLVLYFLMSSYIAAEATKALQDASLVIDKAEIPDFPAPTFPQADGADGEQDGRPPVPAPAFFAFVHNPASVFSVSSIVLDAQGNILNLRLNPLQPAERRSVEFLASFFAGLGPAPENSGALMRLANGDSVYYAKITASIFTGDSGGYYPISVIFYTDVSSVIGLRNSITVSAAILLVALALASLFVPIRTSREFKKATGALCDFAARIGNGDYGAKAEISRYVEISNISASMGKMSEKLRLSENRQKRFFQNVSHEMRTPLMSIKGYAEAILEDVFSKDKAARIISAEASKLAELVDGLLYIARMDSGLEAPGALLPTDVKSLVANCLERLGPVAESSGIRICAELPERGVSVRTDGRKLESAIVNLLANAIRHAKTEIKASCAPAGGGAAIEIQDDGQGIEPDELPFIFDRFYRGARGSFGIGLSICKDVVESLGGSMRAENLPPPGEGAKFAIFVGNCPQ